MKIALLAQRTSDLQFLSEGLPLSQHSLQVSTVTGDLPTMVGELLKQRPDVAVAKVLAQPLWVVFIDADHMNHGIGRH